MYLASDSVKPCEAIGVLKTNCTGNSMSHSKKINLESESNTLTRMSASFEGPHSASSKIKRPPRSESRTKGSQQPGTKTIFNKYCSVHDLWCNCPGYLRRFVRHLKRSNPTLVVDAQLKRFVERCERCAEEYDELV